MKANEFQNLPERHKFQAYAGFLGGKIAQRLGSKQFVPGVPAVVRSRCLSAHYGELVRDVLAAIYNGGGDGVQFAGGSTEFVAPAKRRAIIRKAADELLRYT